MTVYALGLNHKTAPLALREQVAIAPEALPQVLIQLQRSLAQQGLMCQLALLSTCNRTELYLSAPHSVPSEQVFAMASQELAQCTQTPPEKLRQHSIKLSGDDAVGHIFQVACGLDSMVLGEPQILGQLKQAALHAQQSRVLSGDLQQLLQRSFAVAKSVRSQTSVGAASVSMAAAAVRLAQRIFGDLKRRHVLMIGAGEMIALCATHFASQGLASLSIANRTMQRGEALVAQLAQRGHSARAIALAQVPDVLDQHDIVISCTASTLPIIGLGAVQRALAAKAQRRVARTTMMVDLAVPRDIEPEVARLGDVYLYTVDDLGKVVQEGMDLRQAAVSQAQQIVAQGVVDFSQWQLKRRGTALMQAFVAHHEQVLTDTLANVANLSNNTSESALRQARQLSQTLLHANAMLVQQLALDPTVSQSTLDALTQDIQALNVRALNA